MRCAKIWQDKQTLKTRRNLETKCYNLLNQKEHRYFELNRKTKQRKPDRVQPLRNN